MLLSSPSQPPVGRMSQVLPSVKCSNCNVQIPLAELGDHICAPPPPLPTNVPKSPLNLPKPSVSPGAAASLLPQRLQGLVNGPIPSRPNAPAAPPVNAAPSRNDQLRLNTGGSSLNPPSSYPTRPSPLSGGAAAPRSSSRDPYVSGGESPVRSRPPVNNFGRARSGSNASAGMSLTTARPSFGRARSGSNASAGMSPTTARPSFGREREMPPAAALPPPAPLITQAGGEAGMAGVGRRGFAAAAHAAMFAASSAAPAPPLTKASPPRHIDIGATIRSDTTPPLSTSSGSSDSPGIYPESPVSPQPLNGRSRSPPARAPKTHMQSAASISSRASSKTGSNSLYQSSESEYGGLAYADSTATDYEDDDDDAADLRRVNEMRSPVDSFKKNSLPRKDTNSSFQRRDRGDDSESEGSDYGETPSLQRNDSTRVAQAFGLSQTPPSAYDRLGGPGLNSSRSGHARNPSSASLPRGGLSRDEAVRPGLSKSKSTGRERSFSPEARRRDFDDGASMRSRRRDRSPDLRAPKETRQLQQSPARERERAPRKPKVCVRCEKKIDDGKWVSVDGGGVLCEKCWKNMYLPKCRRCNLPIEKQAVSSSDGQLKGKYHRECFNCFTCHKPFPDKTFYVLDGKPLCAYHYHEANDSLCAAARCGQPIEGPCAVSHAGDRYHPEHMLCEFPGHGGCTERLDEYWEVDGRMLCERHSRATRLAEEEADEDDVSSTWSGAPKRKNTRAMKRVTRYIDLANPRG